MAAGFVLSFSLFSVNAQEQEQEFASVTVKKFTPLKEIDPWIKSEITNDVHTGRMVIFSIRDDLPEETFNLLKDKLIHQRFEDLQSLGVWIQARQISKVRFHFFGHDQKFPRWKPSSAGTLIILNRPLFRSTYRIVFLDESHPDSLFEGNLSVLEVLHLSASRPTEVFCHKYLKNIGKLPPPPTSSSAPKEGEKIVP